GTEQPRLVINEVYSEIANDPSDPSLPQPGQQPKQGAKATLDYKVNFWVELHNPLYSGAGQGGGGGNYVGLTDNAAARLQVPTGPKGEPAYPVYKVTITTANQKLRNNDNVRGDPDLDPVTNSYSTVKAEVSDYTPEQPGTQASPQPLQPPPAWGPPTVPI